MMVGDRIRARLATLGMSQSELARRVELSQPAINALIRGASRSSTHLHKIARALLTTPAYLTGETDDPDANAPAPAPEPAVQYVTLPVALPSEAALARMFAGLLKTIDRTLPTDEQAVLLAQRLPIGLSQLRDLIPVAATPAAAKSRAPRARRVPEPQ